MIKGKILRLFLAVLLIISVFTGTTGFVFTTHECIHCGTNFEVSLPGTDNKTEEASCSVQPVKSCCDSPGEPVSEVPFDSGCMIESTSCCHFKSDEIVVSDFLTVKIIPLEHHLPCNAFFSLPDETTSRDYNCQVSSPKNDYGGSIKIHLYCQLLT